MKKKLHIVQFSYNKKYYNFFSISCIKNQKKVVVFIAIFKINKFDVEVRCQNGHITQRSPKRIGCVLVIMKNNCNRAF